MKRALVRRRHRSLALLCVAACVACATLGPARTCAAQSQAPVFPSPEEIERDLLRALNGERTGRGLPAVGLSPALSRLAKAHSAEMAEREVLAHESAAGRSFTERMIAAGLAFAAGAENVARSGTHVAAFIHQSFMDSPGHRENILNPLFDEVGIGIVRGRDGAYYVTEDFRRTVVEKPATEVRAMVLDILNRARTAAGRPPVVLLDEADRAADALAKEEGAGRPLPPLPAFNGPASARITTGPELEKIASALRSPDLAEFGRVGIGVWFGRHPAYPGGAYVVCVILIKARS
jgi:uncharacterized protein YkwD